MCSRLRVVTLLYHEVIDNPAESGFQAPSALPYKHKTDYFLQNLDVIARTGVRISSVHDIDFDSGGRHVVLTFDDGGRSAMRTADYIEERGWKGHFFITTSMIGSPCFVSAENIRDLRRRGHVVGSHSHTHPSVFWRLTEEEMLREWRTSCETLSAILQEPITAASVPGGDMNRMTVDTAAQAGIKYLFTSEPTIHPWRRHGVICLGRLCPKRDTSLQAIEDYVQFRGLLKPLLIRRCKQAVKRLLGPIYHRRENRRLAEGILTANKQPNVGSRVVVLTGASAWHRNTCATLIDRGVNVVGICRCRQTKLGLPLPYILRSIKRQGLSRVTGEILGRIAYLAINARRDRAILRKLFNNKWINSVLAAWNGPTHRTNDYSAPQTLKWLNGLEPDVLVVHSSAWVGKKVRDVPRKGIVIGGHPGITPCYRGAHSAFWALYNNRPEDVGWSVFWLDAGVDTGDLIAQGTIPIEKGDSYFTLGWKGMVRIAEVQAQAVRDFDNGQPLRRSHHQQVPPDSEFHIPTLCEYLTYRRRQSLSR